MFLSPRLVKQELYITWGMYTMLKENTLEETFTRTLESFLMKFDWHWKEQLNFMSKTMFSPIEQ